uniref:Uncharacterized protein n=1 Tax=Parascaris equorum TaxID=6256 RepID=A0A914SDQ9_PAREQ
MFQKTKQVCYIVISDRCTSKTGSLRLSSARSLGALVARRSYITHFTKSCPLKPSVSFLHVSQFDFLLNDVGAFGLIPLLAAQCLRKWAHISVCVFVR